MSINILIAKPIKSDKSFICQIKAIDGNPYKKKVNATIMSYQVSSDKKHATILLKCKSLVSLIYKINEIVLDTVKKESVNWFKKQMTEELIEEYFSNSLIYDTDYGHVIKMRIPIESLETLSAPIEGKNVNTWVRFEHIRIYKQKFNLEMDLELVTPEETSRQYLFEDEADHPIEESPCPNVEELKDIKKEKLQALKEYIDQIKSLRNAIKDTDPTSENMILLCEDADKLLY